MGARAAAAGLPPPLTTLFLTLTFPRTPPLLRAELVVFDEGVV